MNTSRKKIENVRVRPAEALFLACLLLKIISTKRKGTKALKAASLVSGKGEAKAKEKIFREKKGNSFPFSELH